jgi:hypothetical protein
MQFEPSTSRHGNPADWNIPPQLSRFTNRQISVCLLEEIPKMAKCGARTKSGKPCRSPATKKGRCRLHGGSFTIPVVVHEHTCGLQSGCTSSPIISRRVQTIREHNERTGVSLHPVPIERRTVMASRDAVDEKVTAAVGADTRSITSSVTASTSLSSGARAGPPWACCRAWHAHRS